MFNMKIKRQLNLKDRTLLLGIPNYDGIPKVVVIKGAEHKVLGASFGARAPYFSLEIEKTDSNYTREKASFC